MLNRALLYDIPSDTFSNLPKMPYAAHSMCAAERRSTGRVYLVGGKARSEALQSTLVYDVEQSHFQTLPQPMAEGRFRLNCQVLDQEGKLLAAGGLAVGWDQLNSVEVYDIDAGNGWTRLGDMDVPGKHTYFTMGPRMAAMSDKSRSVYYYDPGSDVWEKEPRAGGFRFVDTVLAIHRRDLGDMCWSV